MDDMKRAFGDVPEGFDAFVGQTIEALRDGRAVARRSRPPRAAIVLCAAVLLATAVALALFSGLRTLDAPHHESTPLPSATRAIVEQAPIFPTASAT